MEKQIHVNHINIRTSISLLLAKLLFIEIFTGFLAIVAFSSMGIVSDTFAEIQLRLYSIPVFCGFLVIKMLFSVYIVLQWINEYYEITPTVIYHRSGVIFKKEE